MEKKTHQRTYGKKSRNRCKRNIFKCRKISDQKLLKGGTKAHQCEVTSNETGKRTMNIGGYTKDELHIVD